MKKGQRIEGDQERIDQERAVIANVRRILSTHFDKVDGVEHHKWISALAQKLIAKYPDRKTYKLWHELIGSTWTEEACLNFDFPGDDSIQKAVEALEV